MWSIHSDLKPITMDKRSYRKLLLFEKSWYSFKEHFNVKWDEILLLENEICEMNKKVESGLMSRYDRDIKLNYFKRDVLYKISEKDIHINVSLIALILASLSFFIGLISQNFFMVSIDNKNEIVEKLSNIVSDINPSLLNAFVLVVAIVFGMLLFLFTFSGTREKYNTRILEYQLEIVNKHIDNSVLGNCSGNHVLGTRYQNGNSANVKK